MDNGEIILTQDACERERMEANWHINRSKRDYDVARANANKGEDTCAFTVGMLIFIIDSANEQIAELLSQKKNAAT